jgi:putative tryptophan/tyrosine transport system substrate-binding protein
VRRREFITTLASATVAWPLRMRAQPPGAARKIGFLASEPPTPAMLSAFRDGLRERGYVEAQNLSIDIRWPQGSLERISDLADELVRSKVDVILAWATPACVAAQRATSAIPIVVIVGDPVGSGLVNSLARPGGNITGLSILTWDLSGKQVELLGQVAPGIRRLGIVANLKNPAVVPILRELQAAARVLDLQFQTVDAQSADELEGAFARLSTEGVNGVVVVPDPSVIAHRDRIAELVEKTRLPTVFQRRENVEAGGLMSYGPRLTDEFRQAAVYVDQILKGERPADLPVQQVTRVELVINLKSAKALGLTVPPSLLARADEVIE